MANKSQSYLPESMYSVDSTMTYEKIYKSGEQNEPLTGKIFRLTAKALEIDFGGGIIYNIPFNEFTIYPIYKENGELTAHIYTMVGRKIRVKVTINDDGSFNLSRKAHMLEALETLKSESYIEHAQIISFSKLSAFVDIGAGIMGRVSTADFAPVRYHNIKDIGIKEGTIIPLKIKEYLPEINSFGLSRVQTFEDPENTLEPSSVVICQIFERVISDPTNIGYHALIEGKYSGIVNSELVPLQYGDKVAATVRKIRKLSDGRIHIHLNFVNKVWD